MAEKNIPKKGKRFDQQAFELLENHDGLFVGEYHEFPALRQSLTKLAPAFKARGVTTQAFEIDQKTIDAILKAKSVEEFVAENAKNPLGVPKGMAPAELAEMVRAYDALGIKVIGHEDNEEVAKRMMADFQRDIKALTEPKLQAAQKKAEEETKGIEDPKKREAAIKEAMKMAQKEVMESKEVAEVISKLAEGKNDARRMAIRNQLSAEYIQKKKLPGKVLVVGGAAHSQYAFKLAKDGKPEGVDRRLGIPAINIEPIDGRGGQVGDTLVIEEGKGYSVLMPADLKELNLSSWPPAGGVPFIEQSAEAPFRPLITGKTKSSVGSTAPKQQPSKR